LSASKVTAKARRASSPRAKIAEHPTVHFGSE
jgi:hypothetical protein